MSIGHNRFYAKFLWLLFAGSFFGAVCAERAVLGTFYVGSHKAELKPRQMEWQWVIGQALAFAWPSRFEGSVCVLVRNGKVLLLGDEANFAGIHDLPVKSGDVFHRYSEEDVKAWNLPVVQEADAIRILKAEAEKELNKARAKPSGATDATSTETATAQVAARPAGPGPMIPSAPAPVTAAAGSVRPSWFVWLIALVSVATLGLLGMWFKRRRKT